jgi:type I restriction enzyme S subunit
MNSLAELPPTWSMMTIGGACEALAGFGFPKHLQGKKEGEFPFFKVADISRAWEEHEVYLREAQNYLSHEEATSLGATPFPSETTVFAKIGEAIHLNRRAILAQPSLVDNNIMGLHPNSAILDSRYLFFFTCTLKLGLTSRATTVPSIRKSDVQNINIPVPPLSEQGRVVAKIDELLTKVDAGIHSLHFTKAWLKRYRNAILRSAFQGELTDKWRSSHQDDLARIGALMEQLKNERIKHTKRKQKTMAQELVVAPDIFQLPVGWIWTRVGDVSELLQYGTSEKAGTSPVGIPVLRMGNIQDGRINFDDLKYFPRKWPHLDEFELKAGDILFNRTNSAELVGKTAVYEKWHRSAVFASYLIRVRVDGRISEPHFLAFYINSEYGRHYIASVASQQVGQANVNGTKLSMMPIPLPPLNEQCELVGMIEYYLSKADKTEEFVGRTLNYAEKLRHSILRDAFRGKLISPQHLRIETPSAPAESEKKLRPKLMTEKEKSSTRENTGS